MPVDDSSPAHRIREAYERSGYLRGLSYEQRKAAARDPARWLRSHAYLYDAYPTHFSKTPPDARINRSRRPRFRRTTRPPRGLRRRTPTVQPPYKEEASRTLTTIENEITSISASVNSLENDVTSDRKVLELRCALHPRNLQRPNIPDLRILRSRHPAPGLIMDRPRLEPLKIHPRTALLHSYRSSAAGLYILRKAFSKAS